MYHLAESYPTPILPRSFPAVGTQIAVNNTRPSRDDVGYAKTFLSETARAVSLKKYIRVFQQLR